MLIPNHPHEERLAALASADADAIADEALTSHVTACASCTETVTELGALRASLAELPDLRPVRPLRLLPDVADAPGRGTADRVARWVRRAFAPVVAAGATLAMVGLVGTTAPLVGGGDSGGPFENVGSELDAADGGEAVEAPGAGPASGEGGLTGADNGEDVDTYQYESFDAERQDEADDSEALTTLPAERSLWPMALFTGVALVVFALLLRWIIVPRAG
jgi:hypothetical protein